MKPISLKLRGAIGIHDGLGLDEIVIDFTKFSPGLVGIVGRNGSGKTTLLENMHPFLQLASRNGSLANHFFLRDSCRDFTFEIGGKEYRANISIDAKTGKSEAYLYCNGQPLNDGKVNTYKVEIEKLLGSPDLFFRSIFGAQNATSITTLTPSKRKELFIELLGLERYERYADICKKEADEVEKDIAGKQAKTATMNEEVGKRSIVENELTTTQEVYESVKAEAEEIQQQITATEKEISVNETKIAADDQNRVRIHDLRNEQQKVMAQQYKNKCGFEDEIKKLEGQKAEVRSEVERKQRIVEHKAEIESSVQQLTELRAQEKELAEQEKRLKEVWLQESAARVEYERQKAKYDEAVNSLRHKIELTTRQKESLEKEAQTKLDGLKSERERLEKSAQLIDEVPCHAVEGMPETCKLLVNARSAKDRVGVLHAEIDTYESGEWRHTSGFVQLENDIAGLNQELQVMVPPTNGIDFSAQKQSVGYDEKLHERVRNDIGALEVRGWEKVKEELAVAESVIAEKKVQLSSIEGQIADASKRHAEHLAELETELKAKKQQTDELEKALLPQAFRENQEAMKSALVTLKQELQRHQEKKTTLLADIQFRQEMLDRIDNMKKELMKLEEEIGLRLAKLENWRILQRACSKDGIPALELDAAGPEVSRIANELLASTFGTRFQISFETTRLTKKDEKQVETFEIRVYGEDGEKKIEDLSGGQRVWVETALQEAIAIYLSAKSGREFLTSYADERDGALDPDNKQHFINMLRESFKVGRRHFTFLISQTPEIYSQVQQRIHLVPKESKLEIVY